MDRKLILTRTATAAVVFLALAPVVRMGWLRDDWLYLWHALDPDSTPPGAAGAFPRPVAELSWRISAALAGDATWAMHLLVVGAWLALLAGVRRWHRAWGGDGLGALVAIAALVAHGALVEPRLWASAGNGVLAAAFGIWGAWYLREEGGSRLRLALGTALLGIALLARADAVLLMALPLAERRGRDLFGWFTAAFLGVAVLAWMVLSTHGALAVRPEAAGRLLRLLLVPWGPPLPALAQAALGAAGLAAAAVALLRGGAPRRVALAATTAAVLMGGAVAGWTPAGRYVLMPAIALALLLGGWRGRRRWLLAPWLALHLAGTLVGNTATDLLQRSRHETRLYRSARALEADPGDLIAVVEPPAVGWGDGAADLENVLSAALRRPVVVQVRDAGVPIGRTWSVVAWDGEDWEWRLFAARD